MLKNIKGAIFDMDGTLIDSMWVWAKVDIEFLSKRGIPLPSNLKDEIEHLSFTEVAKYFKRTFNLPESVEEIIQEWDDLAYYHYTHDVCLKPGVVEYLTSLKLAGIKIGLATSNSSRLLEAGLKFTGIYEFFDVITTSDEVKKDKSSPDIYLITAEKLGIKPEHCIVFEDILPAVISAKSAGMKVVGVSDSYSKHQTEDIKRLADKFISKYQELTSAV